MARNTEDKKWGLSLYLKYFRLGLDNSKKLRY